MDHSRIIIYSHGWGVRKDDNGLFTSLVDALPDVHHVLFDYNRIDEAAGTMFVPPIQDQAVALSATVERVRAEFPDATIDIVAHSQGCVVAALAKPQGIRKFLLLAPPSELDVDRRVAKYGARPGAEMNLDGISRIPNKDGTVKLVPAEYWQGLRELQPVELYLELGQAQDIMLVVAGSDNIVLPLPEGLDEKLSIETVSGADHGFYGEARQLLVDLVRRELC